MVDSLCGGASKMGRHLVRGLQWWADTLVCPYGKNYYLQIVESVRNILVTGATGLLGTHLLVRLMGEEKAEGQEGRKAEGQEGRKAEGQEGRKAEGQEGRKAEGRIIGLRRESSDMEEVKRVFSFYGDGWEDLYDAVEWRYGDMLDADSLSKALEGISLVYHCAAIVSFDPREREKLIQANVQGTRNLIEEIFRKNGKSGNREIGNNQSLPNDFPTSRFHDFTLVHISSTSALGDSPGNDPNFLVNEETPRNPNRRHSGYSVSKYESEKIVWDAIDKGLNAWIVNPGIILGPGFWDKGSSKLFSTIHKGLKFYTSGGTGYVDVRDVVGVLVEESKGRRVEESKVVGRYCLVGANLYFRDFFNLVADEFAVKRPSIKAGKFLSGLAWRIGSLQSRISGTYPLITRETAESANRISFYSSKKVENDLNFKFRTIEETITWISRFI